jgi:hypothetical protein
MNGGYLHLDGGFHRMALTTVSSGTLPLASDVQQLVDIFSGKHDIGAMTFAPKIDAPTLGAASATPSAGTGLPAGVYQYVFTYKTGYKRTNGAMSYTSETTPTSALSATTASTNLRVTLASLPTSWPTSAVGLSIYRTTIGGAIFKLVTVLTAPASSYIDSLVDGSLGVTAPTVNSTGVTSITSNAGSAVYAYKQFGGL